MPQCSCAAVCTDNVHGDVYAFVSDADATGGSGNEILYKIAAGTGGNPANLRQPRFNSAPCCVRRCYPNAQISQRCLLAAPTRTRLLTASALQTCAGPNFASTVALEPP